MASREVAAKAIGELKAKGMQVNEVSAPELAKMRSEIKPVIEKYSAAYDPAIVSTFKSEIERVQKF